MICFALSWCIGKGQGVVFQARKGTRSLCEPAVQIRIPDGIILYHHFWHGHQHEGDDAAQSIDTVDDDAKLHKVMLYLHFSVHDGGEEAAENHEGRIRSEERRVGKECM